jgi:hypothetical protein
MAFAFAEKQSSSHINNPSVTFGSVNVGDLILFFHANDGNNTPATSITSGSYSSTLALSNPTSSTRSIFIWAVFVQSASALQWTVAGPTGSTEIIAYRFTTGLSQTLTPPTFSSAWIDQTRAWISGITNDNSNGAPASFTTIAANEIIVTAVAANASLTTSSSFGVTQSFGTATNALPGTFLSGTVDSNTGTAYALSAFNLTVGSGTSVSPVLSWPGGTARGTSSVTIAIRLLYTAQPAGSYNFAAQATATFAPQSNGVGSQTIGFSASSTATFIPQSTGTGSESISLVQSATASWNLLAVGAKTLQLTNQAIGAVSATASETIALSAVANGQTYFYPTGAEETTAVFSATATAVISGAAASGLITFVSTATPSIVFYPTASLTIGFTGQSFSGSYHIATGVQSISFAGAATAAFSLTATAAQVLGFAGAVIGTVVEQATGATSLQFAATANGARLFQATGTVVIGVQGRALIIVPTTQGVAIATLSTSLATNVIQASSATATLASSTAQQYLT